MYSDGGDTTQPMQLRRIALIAVALLPPPTIVVVATIFFPNRPDKQLRELASFFSRCRPAFYSEYRNLIEIYDGELETDRAFGKNVIA